MVETPIATAADYADAILIARRARSWLTLLLVVMLLLQIALFFMVRTDVIQLHASVSDDVIVLTTQPALQPDTQPAGVPPALKGGAQVVQYLTGLVDFLGIVFVLVLATVLLVLVLIMLVGRLIGVAHVTAALIGCLLLAALLFPWQAFLNNVGLTAAQADFKIPGVLYTWNELLHRAKFQAGFTFSAFLSWARFVGFPVLALAMLIWIHVKSSRGLRLALGESDAPSEQAPLAES